MAVKNDSGVTANTKPYKMKQFAPPPLTNTQITHS